MELPAIVTGKATVVDESTVDYIGHYKGYPVAFDAKECGDTKLNIKTNCKPHQVQFLEYFKNCSTDQKIVISGFIVYFYNEDPNHIYFIEIDDVKEALGNGKKSFSISEISLKFKMDEYIYEGIINSISNRVSKEI